MQCTPPYALWHTAAASLTHSKEVHTLNPRELKRVSRRGGANLPPGDERVERFVTA
jgi:hypothetical protein